MYGMRRREIERGCCVGNQVGQGFTMHKMFARAKSRRSKQREHFAEKERHLSQEQEM